MKSFIATTLFLGCVGRLVHAQVSAWGQCGGQDWTGGTTSKTSVGYSQCIPGTAGATTTSKAPTTTTSTAPTSTASSKGTFTNPIKKSNGSDPYILKMGRFTQMDTIVGIYSMHFLTIQSNEVDLTTTTWSNIQITRATTINGLKTATPKVIWTDTATDRCCSMSITPPAPRMAPLYIFTLRKVLAPTFGAQPGVTPVGSSFQITTRKMNSATTIGNAVVISVPTNSWETVGAPVNEGPVALINNGRVWVFFSASLCSGTGYKLGRLELVGSDLLNASSWQKYSNPVLLGANGNYEPGHNGFFSGPSGNAYIVYHASAASPGTCDGSRVGISLGPDSTSPSMKPDSEPKPGRTFKIIMEEQAYLDAFVAMVNRNLKDLKKLKKSWDSKWVTSGIWPLIFPLLGYFKEEVAQYEASIKEITLRLADLSTSKYTYEDGFNPVDMPKCLEDVHTQYERCATNIRTMDPVFLEKWRLDTQSPSGFLLPLPEREYRQAVCKQQEVTENANSWLTKEMPQYATYTVNNGFFRYQGGHYI
ncbi:glycoside hydrolase family 43 protein [Serendipita vermifera MAFF 305830]|uniref:Glycoside hydrolase family 43 protein n=1 Tax=Serendipita vermifera MAFF 305830 TaxID=933852 RepID=A0A0C2XEU6_SERVB|nr:glycoside hydrolase family 43 protein [Serendipita vermifera MAFF 305830]